MKRVPLYSAFVCGILALSMAGRAIGQNFPVKESDVKPDTQIVAEQYLLMGDATRGSAESQVSINPLNPNEIAVAAMGVLNQFNGEFQHDEHEFQRTPRATITRFAITRDRGLTWTVFEDPMRAYFHRYRCLDPFSAFTPTGEMILGCESHFPTNLDADEQIDAALNNEQKVYGGSAIIWSNDGGLTFSHPVQVIGSGMPKEIYGPFVSFAHDGTTGDAPKIKVDASNGKIYIDGHSPASEPPHSQTIFRMSKDGGRDWGMVYAFDSADWPGSGATYDVANGIVGAAYTATQVPASLGVKCPCRVFATSTDDGKTFERHILPASGAVAPQFGPNNEMFVAADPTRAGHFTVLVNEQNHLDAYLTEDSGKTWSAGKPLGTVPTTWVQDGNAQYGRNGIIGASWMVNYPDPNNPNARMGGPPGGRGGPGKPHVFMARTNKFEIWSAISKDGGTTWSAPLKVSTAPSPGIPLRRGDSSHGADFISLAVGPDFVHMSWFDSRSGFLGTWYGRVPIADYK
jgi:hypothetical protein